MREERKRIFKLVEQAYDLDPRIKKEQADEQAEIQKAKEARKAANELKNAKIEENKARLEADKIKAAEEEKMKKAQEKEEIKQINKKYRETVKEVSKFCEGKMPGSRFDKFFVGELVKKYAKQDALDKLFDSIKAIDAPQGDQFIDQFR